MKNNHRKVSLILVFITAAIGIALCVTLVLRINDGQRKAAALKAEADDLLYNEVTGVKGIDNQKTVLYEEQDHLTEECKALQQQIKNDETAIARDKQNMEELAVLYQSLDETQLRTDVWNLATDLLTANPEKAEDVKAIVKACDANEMTFEDALAKLQAMEPATAEATAE